MSDGPHAPTLLERLAMARAAQRCGARRRDDQTCQGPAMQNGRCRMHGGKSTGPRTANGLQRCRQASWKHGLRSAAAIAERRKAAVTSRLLRHLIAAL